MYYLGVVFPLNIFYLKIYKFRKINYKFEKFWSYFYFISKFANKKMYYNKFPNILNVTTSFSGKFTMLNEKMEETLFIYSPSIWPQSIA